MKKIIPVLLFLIAGYGWGPLVPAFGSNPHVNMDQIVDQDYAIASLPSSAFVNNPDYAIGKPDLKFAEIEYWGYLDLQAHVKNEPGNDIAIYANRSSGGVQDYRYMHYLVIVNAPEGMRIIGIGGGTTGPEEFDLQDIPRVDMIRIMYRNRAEIYAQHRDVRTYPRGFYKMSIDALEVLH